MLRNPRKRLPESREAKIMNVSSVPLVSIGMPVYNCAATLGAAIRSILNQTFSDWELLLVDDGSTDGTLDLARAISDPRIRVFADRSHLGLVARLNQVVDLSRGTYFARMDGDDVSYPERLALQREYLEEHPEIDLLAGGVLVFGRDGQVLGTRENRITHQDICRRPWAGFYLWHPTWIGLTRWFRKHPYCSAAVRCEDQELLLRTYEHSRFAMLPEIVLGYREEELSLRKILTGRRSFVRAAVRKSIPRGEYGFAIKAVVNHTLKAVVDCLAIGSGLNYKVLRHRALPVEQPTVQRWMQVWNEVQIEYPAVRALSLAASSQL